MFALSNATARGRCTWFFLVAAWGLVTLGCAGGLRTEAEGGLPWREYETEHFVLRTDAEAGEALEAVRHLEDLFFVLGTVAFPYEPRFESRTEVIVFSQEDDLDVIHRDILGLHLSGHTWLQTMPTIVVAGRNEAGATIVTHEMVHRFVAFNYPQAPLWLHEGLARYYETLRIEDDSLTVGEHPLANRPNAYYRSGADELLPVTELRGLDREGFYASEKSGLNYTSAWTLINAFQMEPRKRGFQAYLDALQAGRVSEEEAFREHCQRWLDESFRRDRAAVLEKKATEVTSFSKFRRPEPPAWTSKAMRPADVHVLWARLLEDWPEESLREAERAREFEPDHPEALLVLAAVDPRADQRLITKRLWAAYEKSNRAPRYGAILLRTREVSDPEHRRRLDNVARKLVKEARTSLELEALGGYLLDAGRATTAKKYAEQAVIADPSSPRAYRLLARIAATEGDYARALHFQTWSVNFDPHQADPEEVRLLDEYEKKLLEAPPRAAVER